jgi:hypothetical protein
LAAITGGKLVAVVGVRRLLTAGQSLLAIAMLLLTRIPLGANFATNVLPALLLAGLAGGIAAPAAQIGALSGDRRSLASRRAAGSEISTHTPHGGDPLHVTWTTPVDFSRSPQHDSSTTESARLVVLNRSRRCPTPTFPVSRPDRAPSLRG